jgi:hypothetical protein
MEPDFADLFEQSIRDKAKAKKKKQIRAIVNILAVGFNSTASSTQAEKCYLCFKI